MQKSRQIDAIYPLSPMQQGMLFHTIYAPDSGVYFHQVRCVLEGELDASSLREAWQRVLDRHAILRTAFVWEHRKQPLQVVHPQVPLPWVEEDWRGLSPSAQQEQVEAYLERDRQTGFVLSKAPLLRCALLRTADDAYEFIWSYHHILLDGWSLALLLKEVFGHYAALQKHERLELPPPRPYQDYIAWLKRQTLADAESFWRNTLRGFTAPTPLALARSQANGGGTDDGEVQLELSTELTAALNSLAARHKLTVNTMVQGGWALLLSRYSGEREVVYGATVSGRPADLPGIESMIGLFINTLPVRVRVSGEELLTDWLQAIQAHQVDSRQYEFSPLVQVQGWSEVPRKLPLFESIYIFENYLGDALGVENFGNVRVRDIRPIAHTNYPLTLMVYQGRRLLLKLFYDSARFDHAVATRMLDHLRTVLESMIADPHRRISDLKMLTAAERERLIAESSETETEDHSHTSLHRLFESQVEQTPLAPALICEQTALSYTELNRRANQLAHHLRSLGVGPEVIVGVCLPRSVEMVVALLAILKAGGAYLPLDPAYPSQRLSFMMRDSKMRVLVTETGLSDELAAEDVPVVHLDGSSNRLAGSRTDNPATEVSNENLAYVIYTSGSTGTPKGVQIPHAAAINLLLSMSREPGFDATDTLLAVTTLSFDIAALEIFLPLITGAQLVLASRETATDAAQLSAALERYQVTAMQATPATWRMLIESDWQGRAGLKVLCGGEALSRALADQLLTRSDEVWNVYGPTETTIWSAIWHVDQQDNVPIGKPIARTQLYVLDEHARLVAEGVAGELYIGGAGLARGYRGRPDLTAEKFVPNPFSALTGARMYGTGDLVRRLPTGDIEYIARVDNQVKVRGFRIELGEIEAALEAHPSVREAVVTVREDARGDKRLVAYLVPDAEALPQQTSEQDAEVTSQWQMAWDETYAGSPAQTDAAFNLTGWNSSYTGAPIPAAEMQQWVDQTVARILSLKPKRVLEIGCGTGLLLARIAPHCDEYSATDFSPNALRNIEQICVASKLDHVKLFQRPAHDFTEFENETFDTVILNSVIQYFPDANYLLRILESASRLVKPGGTIFLGDVRNLLSQEALYGSIELQHASADVSLAQLRQRIQKRIAQEEELVITPALFYALKQHLPAIAQVQVRHKRGRYQNELWRFRYDVLLRIDEPVSPDREYRRLNWNKENLSLARLQSLLTTDQPDVLHLVDVPNARCESQQAIVEALAIMSPEENVGHLHTFLSSIPKGKGCEPEDFWALSESLPYLVEVIWNESTRVSSYDVVLKRSSAGSTTKIDSAVAACLTPAGEFKSWTSYTNRPSQGKLASRLVPRLRKFVEEKLPSYMIPTAFVLLTEMPLTPNGKVDRRQLAQLELGAAINEEDFVAARTPTEELIAGVWQEVLGIERVGIDNDFFELGGHSLLAMQVIARLRDAFKLELPLRLLFGKPTIRTLAQGVEEEFQTGRKLDAPPIEILPREEKLPLSFAQQRLWFLDQMEPGNPFYNLGGAVRLRGPLDTSALKRSFDEVLRRHEVLRASFTGSGEDVRQVIASEAELQLPVVDLEHFEPEQRETEIRRLAVAEAQQPFDLGHGPLLRTTLLRLDEEEHVVLFTMHHIVSDEWSIGVLIKEIGVFYEAFSRGKPALLPELKVQYADYAGWQQRWLSEETTETLLAYWKKQLDGAPLVLDLPAEGARPPVQSYQGATYQFELGAALTEKLKASSRQQGATLFMTLLAAFQTLVYRYTGQEDFVIGTPVANRSRQELEPLIGFFVNLLVLRSQLNAGITFPDHLRRVRETALDAYAHQDLPFEKLVEELQPERDLSRSPVFQILFALQNAPVDLLSPDLAGVEMSAMEIERGISRYDLGVSVMETNGSLYVAFEYNTQLFAASRMMRMAGHYVNLLESIVADPQKKVGEMELIGEEERRQLLSEWNETARSYSREACVHELVQQHAANRPTALALTYQNDQLTFGEWNKRANRLAHYLRRLGVGPEVMVGICVERSLEWVVALLGILKAGGAYVALDPSYPAERLAYMLQDSNVPVLVTQERLQPLLTSPDAQVVCLDWDSERFAEESDQNPEPLARVENLAYVTYTSGSTGRPKAVMTTHGSLLNLVFAHQRDFKVTEQDRSPQFAQMGFDASVWELWTYLTAGASVHLADDETRLSPAKLREWFVEKQITIGWLPPVLAETVLDNNWPEQLSLRLLITGSDKARRHPPPSLPFAYVNSYGPTEATVIVTWGEVPLKASSDGAPLIGRAIDNTQIYMLDRQLRPVPIGVPGELCIGGVSLGRGYLNWPDLTAEKFVPDAFGSVPGMRLYRTGDLARYNEDGNIEFLGRIDDQVKVRGFRIELGEIETVLAEHPDVRTALILVNEDAANDKRLIAYVVPQQQSTNGAGNHSSELTSRLAQYLRDKLPAYMVPSAFVLLKEMPLSPNGKLNRRLLPAPDENGLVTSENYISPRTEAEKTLAEIFQRVLKIEDVGVYDNFFQLGGHSLLATQVVSLIREQFDIELSLRSFFSGPTIAGLAEIIASQSGGQSIAPGSLIKPVSRLRPLPLSFAQQRLWFVDRLDSGSTAYNVPLAVRLSGSLNVEVLSRTLSEVVRRHEILRTTLEEIDGEPRQIIAPPSEVELPLVDLCGLEEAEQEAALQRHIEEAANQRFDLARGPLLKAELLKLGADEHVLILTMHHIITDGWSTGVLVNEVGVLYEAFAAGRQSPLSELPIQYADYAIWQRDRLQGEVLEELLDYWRVQLAGAPSLELPTDRPRPARQSYRGARVAFELNEELTKKLRDLSQREGVTLFMTLLSGWQTLLARYSGQWDVSVGTPIANRTRHEIEGLIGFFVNTLVLRTQMKANASFREQLQQVREVCLGAYAHQDVPFERVVEELQPERDMSRSPLFQVLFEMQNAPLGELELEGLKLEPLAGKLDTTKFDLTLTTMEAETGLLVWCEYSTDLFEQPTIALMLDHWHVLLEAAVADPDQSLAKLPLLTEAERQQLMAWNETDVAYPRDGTIADLFTEQAARTPAAVAVEHEDVRLRYAELNRRANQLAHHLRRLGVGPEVRVGLSIDRSPELVVGLLGVLKAGGAYVPLDRDYPLERLRFMIEDAQLRVVLTKEPAAFADAGVQVIDLTTSAEEISRESEAEPESGVTADNLAYVIYTSGSTGTPKGVEVDHRAVLRTVLNTDYIQLTPADRVAQAANTAFDASTFEIWGTLLNGATSVVLEKEVVLGGEKLSAALKARQISVLYLTAALFHHMAQVDPAAFAPLRAVLFGGETVDPRWLRAVLEAGPPERLLHLYGPTEVTVFSTWKMVTELANDALTVSIGRSIANTESYVLDEWLQLTPVGVNGELYHGGDGLARGYLNRPELTAQRFVPHPFARHAGERLYRTGDVVRYHADGELEFVGRRDAQVKVRGFRIELGEIETVLTQHPQVRQAVAVVREPQPGNKQLVAYVAGDVAAGELRSYLKEKLPEYMAPQLIVVLKSLPLTRVGKIDRQALPAPDAALLESENYVAPRTAMEQTLADIFQRVLKVEEVGVYDNFFELGGHSLLATQIVSKIREQFAVELPLRSFFNSPTVADIAEILESELKIQSGVQEPEIKSVSRLRPLPLSFAQQGLWLTDRLDPGSTAYNVPLAVRLSGSLNVEVLSRTLSEVVRRHEILRTTLEEIDGEPRQIIAPPSEVELPLVDLCGLEEAEQEAALQRHVEEAADQRFDFARGPLLKFELLKLAADEHVLILAMHHIITDGWSTGVLVNEVGALYEAFAAGRESPLPELPIQYADYAIWQRERLQGEVLEELLDYWRVQLAGASSLDLPADYSRTPESFRSASLPFELSPELTAALKEISWREGVTLFMTLLTCWQLFLARYTGQEDIVVTSPIANRTQVGFESLIGLFVNLLVLRTEVSGELTFLELLGRVREVCFDAYAHQDLPFERLVQELQPERQSSRSPLFQVLFQLQNMPQQELKLPGLKLTTLPIVFGAAKVDLTLTMSEFEDALFGEFTYSQNLASESIIGMERQWRTLLESVVENPECPISLLEMDTEEESVELIDSFNTQLEV